MNIVILAAGMGKRMHSRLPKTLHTLAGRSLLSHVLKTAQALQPKKIIVVIGHEAEKIRTHITDCFTTDTIHFVIQSEQLGTGHAVMQAIPELDETQPTLVLYGDVPLIQESTLRQLIQAAGNENFALLTTYLDNPNGYGRIIREQEKIVRITEQKDASVSELTIKEINTGILICPTHQLKKWLASLSNNNAQGEYYLTDLVACAANSGMTIVSGHVQYAWEILGVNNKTQLAELERLLQSFRAQQLLDAGVTLIDPQRIDIRGTLQCDQDVVIDVGCIFEGEVHLGEGVHIGPYTFIRNSQIAEGSQIFAYSHIDGAKVGSATRIGPYARLRPGSKLDSGVHIGNFVEIKNSQFGIGSKANHLAYIGDATVGRAVNIGAGTITCNYDGVHKHKTIIEDEAFIGSDTQLVAPVTVGRGATLGAGTTLTKDAPAEKLTISRARQITLDNWQKPQTKKE